LLAKKALQVSVLIAPLQSFLPLRVAQVD